MEKQVVRNLYDDLMNKKPSGLKMAYKHVNLASRNFEEIWKGWWSAKSPPELEVDLILVYEDYQKHIDNAFIIAVEAEFFNSKTKKNFYIGLNQAMAFGILGFDALVLWHIFSHDLDESFIRNSVEAAKEVIESYKLPITYFATMLKADNKLQAFAPLESSMDSDIDHIISWMRNVCDNNRNPSLSSEAIRKRRNVIKVMLKIPV